MWVLQMSNAVYDVNDSMKQPANKAAGRTAEPIDMGMFSDTKW